MKLDILYEDNDIIVCHKAPGVSSQQERSFDPDMVSMLMNYFHKNNVKEPYVGVVHRLDKPVAGVIVYGKNEKATRLLSEQITHHRFTKKYSAIVCGDISTIRSSSATLNEDGSYTLEDYLLRDAKTNTSHVVDISDKKYASHKEVKKCTLRFIVNKTIHLNSDSPFYNPESVYGNVLTLVDIELLTGRHHQIRVQFANSGFPLWGDLRYSSFSKEYNQRKGVALCARSLTFTHPVTKKEMTFEVIPSNSIFKLLS